MMLEYQQSIYSINFWLDDLLTEDSFIDSLNSNSSELQLQPILAAHFYYFIDKKLFQDFAGFWY